ncbi:class I SAM-dependent methyltransferase [Nocardia carnea]|uniref:class I SAM-dependent methyltransferase n=1 Tax=Nocardia carnea TaxID=37328 RepID=UPI00245710FA|nr:class I SAM-dependent methyltransferase [Nocardia carnea]
MTRSGKVDFRAVRWRSVEWTNLCTLYLRACDSRSPHSVLGDIAAADAVDRIDYDWDRVRRAIRPGVNQWLVALRAARLDSWSADFLRRHPDAVVLHLGCGMDTRAFRLRPPPQVRWFDIDQPHVIELRRHLYDDGDRYRMVGTSVTDPGWTAEIPSDRPTLIIAEGLFMYLREAEVRALLQRLTDQFPGGELLFDTVAPIGARLSKVFTKGIIAWGIADPRRLQQWNPRLQLLESGSSLAGADRIPARPLRVLYKGVRATPIGRYDVLNRFSF